MQHSGYTVVYVVRESHDAQLNLVHAAAQHRLRPGSASDRSIRLVVLRE